MKESRSGEHADLSYGYTNDDVKLLCLGYEFIRKNQS
jgi:hypothetical protein